ncbi:MAG: hypothetical protein JL55_39840 [Pseudomonas sp. BICA1-14]|nr:MAG: hypothetical protein JL55_39840 [[Pseudomonas] sp. BICA1-14]
MRSSERRQALSASRSADELGFQAARRHRWRLLGAQAEARTTRSRPALFAWYSASSAALKVASEDA